MSDELRAWLSQELERRGWSQGKLARQAGVSRPFISMVLSGDAGPSVNFCHKVAHALGESPEKVLRLAGLLPPVPEEDQEVKEITDIAKNMPPDKRGELLRYARYLFRLGKG